MMKEKNWSFVLIVYVVSVLLSTTALSQTTTNSDTPNLLFIYADQYRRQAMGFWNDPKYQGALNGIGDPVITPNIDKLADVSIVFTQAVSTQPVCSPFRGMMLSGMFPEKNGIRQNCKSGRNDELRHDAICIMDVLHANGYNNAYFGKAHWHKTEPVFDSAGNYVGSTEAPGGNYINPYDTYVPPGFSRHNIDYWYQSIKDRHKDPLVYSNDPNTINGKTDGEQHRPKIYTPLNEANHIINYINNSDSQRDTNKSFSIFWALNPPHSPYSSLEDCDEEAYNLYYKEMSLIALLNRPNVTTNIADDNVRYYFANITGVDKQIGRVISALEAKGLIENTIIVFTSDHGDLMGSHNKMGKTVEYEESFGVPFLISYPSKLEHRIENLLLGSTDIMPTLLGLMNMKADIPATVDGIDYSRLLLDKNTNEVTKPKSALYLSKYKKKGVRTDKYTFTISKDGSISSLFDNINDPYQLTNLDFYSLPENEQQFLLTELGTWLAKANDIWYQEEKFADLINYHGSDSVVSQINENTINNNSLELLDNYPNPFNTSTNITVFAAKNTDIDLSIYNTNGQLVKTIFKGHISQGQHTFQWDITNENNPYVNPGVFIYRLRSKDVEISKKMYFTN